MRNILILGFTSLLTDMSSEMIYPLLPLFLLTLPGVSSRSVGLLPASLFAGVLYAIIPQAPFVFGAGMGLFAALGMAYILRTHVPVDDQQVDRQHNSNIL